MSQEIVIPPYDTLNQMFERNTQERKAIQAMLRIRSRETEDQLSQPLRLPVPGYGDLSQFAKTQSKRPGA